MRTVFHPATLPAALVLALFVGTTPGLAQKAPAPAPAKPYKAVSVTAPAPFADPGFEAMRKQLAEIVKKKDRAALAGLVVAKGFFWDGEKGDAADKSKSGVDNLAKAVGLDAKDGFGWDMLANFAAEPTASEPPDHKGVVCGPADPKFSEKELEELLKSTGTDLSEWAYPTAAGVEVRAAAKPDAPVIDKLGPSFVRLMPEGADAASETMVRVLTPAGKTGFASPENLAPIGGDQLCYGKEGGAWKIVGYTGLGQGT